MMAVCTSSVRIEEEEEEEEGAFVNTSAGKGWVEVCVHVDGVWGGK